jgi:hypothetical protein
MPSETGRPDEGHLEKEAPEFGGQKPWVAAALVNFVGRLAYVAIGRR